jgi:pheophorbide a oxygenase
MMKVPFLISIAFVSWCKAFVPTQFPSFYPRLGSSTTSGLSTAVGKEIDFKENGATSPLEDGMKIRPSHQNWWPVSSTYYLDKTRPNPVDLLNKKLVVFWSESDKEWKCLDDRCSHRFAPLSEGRVLNDGCLQCAYHGWEFDGQGKCLKVPQSKTETGGRSVTGYPVRVQASMIFVWADPESYEDLGKTVSIPTFPALENALETQGEYICFMRDLPYGYELLGENLLDLSHLPFSHHGVGGLTRDLGGPLSFKMLSASQKSEDNPLYEAILKDAASSDPQFKAMPSPPPDAALNLGFYEPSHVRYTRQIIPGQASSYVSLYFCPSSNSKSRVFLFNLFAPRPAPPKRPVGQRIKSWVSPSGIKERLVKIAVSRILTPTYGHLISHEIFDGDGIFLHKQGDRMQRADLSYKDYDTPSSADVMVNAFRRYSNAAGQATRSMGLDDMAEAVTPSSGYKDNLPRSEMLDRYISHTKSCELCSAGLEKAQIRKRRLETLETALIGATGASTFTLLGALGLGVLRPVTVPSALVRVAAVATTCCLGGCKFISKRKPKAEKEIRQFVFEDYIHADKN